ncbi:MAG: hypothetical protein K0R52_1383 [Alphaproteobacteria bacterium]|nr:hypothetical protein [Alphaproteobacteria bacterium]
MGFGIMSLLINSKEICRNIGRSGLNSEDHLRHPHIPEIDLLEKFFYTVLKLTL